MAAFAEVGNSRPPGQHKNLVTTPEFIALRIDSH